MAGDVHGRIESGEVVVRQAKTAESRGSERLR